MARGAMELVIPRFRSNPENLKICLKCPGHLLCVTQSMLPGRCSGCGARFLSDINFRFYTGKRECPIEPHTVSHCHACISPNQSFDIYNESFGNDLRSICVIGIKIWEEFWSSYTGFP